MRIGDGPVPHPDSFKIGILYAIISTADNMLRVSFLNTTVCACATMLRQNNSNKKENLKIGFIDDDCKLSTLQN